MGRGGRSPRIMATVAEIDGCRLNGAEPVKALSKCKYDQLGIDQGWVIRDLLRP